MTKTQKPEIFEITVEQLTVYRYHVEMTDDVSDPEVIALERFRAGELPDAGPAEGEQHDLSTFVVGEVESDAEPPMTFIQWCEKYRPIENTLCPGAPFDGYMYETFGSEQEYVRRHSEDRIWTVVDAEGDLVMLSGWHVVNRVGFFITERPWDGLQVAEIILG